MTTIKENPLHRIKKEWLEQALWLACVSNQSYANISWVDPFTGDR